MTDRLCLDHEFVLVLSAVVVDIAVAGSAAAVVVGYDCDAVVVAAAAAAVAGFDYDCAAGSAVAPAVVDGAAAVDDYDAFAVVVVAAALVAVAVVVAAVVVAADVADAGRLELRCLRW